MLNNFKKIIFSLYCSYVETVPIQRGKYRLGQMLQKLLGRAVYRVNGILIELNPLAMIDRKMVAGQGHDKTVFEVLHSTLAQGGVFLDVGANIGYFSLLAAKIPNVRVFAFEPSPREIARFYQNISLNGFINITVIPYGLSDQDGFVKLNIAAAHNPGMNSVVNLASISEYVTSVNCYFTSLDSLLAESILANVRLCKIDVEGYEMFVLKGIGKVIHLMLNAVFVIEISPTFLSVLGYKPDDIYAFFAQFGFKPKFGSQDTLQYDEVFCRKQ